MAYWRVFGGSAAAILASWLALGCRAPEPRKANPMDAYQRDVAMLRQEYGRYHGHQLRDPELEMQFRMAADLAAKNNYTGAIDLLERVSNEAAVPVVFNNLGALYASMGDHARAVEAFREALARDPGYAPVRDSFARLQTFTGDEAAPVRQEIEPNNSEAAANLIALERTVNGEIASGDTDTLKFVTPPPPRDILELTVETVDPTLQPGVRVHNSRLTSDSGRVICGAGESLKRYLSQPPNTSIYLVLWGAQNSAGRWKVSVRPLRAFDRYEPNDEILAARKIDVGQPIEANIMDYEDTDFYAFDSPRSGSATIELRNNSSTLIPAITTFDSDRRTSGFAPDVRKPGADLIMKMDIQPYRTYYLQVWPQARSSGGYRLTIH